MKRLVSSLAGDTSLFSFHGKGEVLEQWRILTKEKKVDVVIIKLRQQNSEGYSLADQ